MQNPYVSAPEGVDETAWAAAVAKIRGYCGWHIAPEVTETVTLDGSGGPVIVLPTLQLNDVESITDDGREVVDPEWSRSGIVRRYCWTRKLRGVVAEITHGYEEWPADLEAVTIEIASIVSPAGVSQVNSGTHQISFRESLPVQALETLERYKLPFVQ